MPQVHVAIGVIVDSARTGGAGGRVLITRRAQGDRFEHCWEFPGGKVDPGENPRQCIHREVQEELGVTVRIVAAMDAIGHGYADLSVRLHPFILTLDAGTPRPLASREVRWVTMEELSQIPFPEANAGLVRDLPRIVGDLGLLTR